MDAPTATRTDPPGSASLAIVEAVAAREGVHPTDLEPMLQDAVDPDALETVLSAGAGAPVTVAFEYAGYDVVVGSDGSLVVE